MYRRIMAAALMTLALHSVASAQDVRYTIQRRPAPTQGSREITLPTNIVIDATTWATTQERSRLPINPMTGYAQIMVNPNGTVAYDLPYSTPAAGSALGPFFHFWLAERADVQVPTTAAQAPLLPLGLIIPTATGQPSTYAGPRLTGEFSIVSLAVRTGRITSSSNTLFDDPLAPYAKRPPWEQPKPPLPPPTYQTIFPMLPNMGGSITY